MVLETILAGLAVVGIVFLLFVAGMAVYFISMKRAALNGRFGEESQWAAELVREDDQPFIRAMQGTPQPRLRVFGEMADDKEELRELVVTHYETSIEPQIDEDRNA